MDLSSKQALAEKAKKWMDLSSANYPKDNQTKNKSWVEDGLGEERQNISLRRQIGALQNSKQNKQHCSRTERKMAKGKKRNTLTRRSPREVVTNTYTTKTESPTDSLVKEDQQSP